MKGVPDCIRQYSLAELDCIHHRFCLRVSDQSSYALFRTSIESATSNFRQGFRRQPVPMVICSRSRGAISMKLLLFLIVTAQIPQMGQPRLTLDRRWITRGKVNPCQLGSPGSEDLHRRLPGSFPDLQVFVYIFEVFPSADFLFEMALSAIDVSQPGTHSHFVNSFIAKSLRRFYFPSTKEEYASLC